MGTRTIAEIGPQHVAHAPDAMALAASGHHSVKARL